MISQKPENFEEFYALANSADIIPVVLNLPADLLTPLAVYLKISDGAKNSFLLESVEGGESLARYSFIGANPEMIAGGNDEKVFVQKDDSNEVFNVPLFRFLREHFGEFEIAKTDDLPSFIGGAIGYFGFSCSSWFEKTLRKSFVEEEIQDEAKLMFYKTVIAFDHAKQVIKIISLVFKNESRNEDELKILFENAAAKNEKIKEILQTKQISLFEQTEKTLEKPEVKSNWKREDFEKAVDEIKELINAGECYQVVLSQRFSVKTSASEISIYRALRSLNPSPYMFLLQFDEKAIIGASPEMLVRCRDRKLEYRPIAGTRKRGKTSEEDVELAEEMRRDKKEVAEHLMLVDLGRNDLGRVSKFGSVRVENMMNVEKFSHVQHLVSYLFSELHDDCDQFDALAACFPAGTVSGAPKVRAVEIIQKLEPTPRGVYSGAVGYVDYSGNLDTCIAIRTLVLENGEAKIQAGAGIVADSVPELEFEETVNKARALLRTIEIAES